MDKLPPNLTRLVSETDRLTKEITMLRAKRRLTIADLRKIACFKADLLHLCPPSRYVWVLGSPVADILKFLLKIQIEKEIENERTKRPLPPISF